MSLEVMHFRNKKAKPCNLNWMDDDIEIRKSIMNKVKCVPSYWNKLDFAKYPKCSKPEEMKTVYTDITWNDVISPCRTISKSTWFQTEFPTKRYDKKFENKYLGTYFSARFNFPRTFFKEIHLVRSLDLETMVGNGGGYIGLCLGYSFLQLPSFIHEMSKKIKHFFQR